MPQDWQGKTVVVTGGSSGLGRSIGSAFAERGAQVVLLARDPTRLAQARTSIEMDGGCVSTMAVDLTRVADVDRAFAQIGRDYASLDVLVNAAGRSARAAVLDTTVEDFQSLWELNFLGIVHCTRAAADRLIRAQGHLVNIGSLASKTASRYLGAYPVSKFAVAAYSQQLRLELGPRGLHVLLVCPGPLARQDAGRRYDPQAAGLPEQARRPGGGARLRQIDPSWLARRIVRACERRQPELIVPSAARWLFALTQLWPSLGDAILKRRT
jgi:NAD(P)-dependent dehydrogenase (short-subunit alcohol dehydrogenase family)